jgi:hypothetical protein
MDFNGLFICQNWSTLFCNHPKTILANVEPHFNLPTRKHLPLLKSIDPSGSMVLLVKAKAFKVGPSLIEWNHPHGFKTCTTYYFY